jgi:hypothetical protein
VDWSATAVDDANTPILTFQRSGGFAGMSQQWTVYGDGRIEMPDGSEKQADPKQLQTILDAAQTADFFTLNDSYVPEESCCDQFLYDITIQLDGQNKTIQVTDADSEQPEQVTAVLNAINKLIETVE